MAVRADERQRARLFVERARRAAHRRLGVEEAIRMEREGWRAAVIASGIGEASNRAGEAFRRAPICSFGEQSYVGTSAGQAASGSGRTLVRRCPEHECSDKEQSRRLSVRAPSRERNISPFPPMRKINTRSFVRATRSTPREINRQILLNLVREHQPISRAELARRMKIGRGMVTYLTAELIAAGGALRGRHGRLAARPPAADALRPHPRPTRRRDRHPLQQHLRHADGLQRQLDRAWRRSTRSRTRTRSCPSCRRACSACSPRTARRGKCEGIGLVVPGMVDADHRPGAQRAAARLARTSTSADRSRKRSGFPVHVENAPIACALAQMWLGQPGAHRCRPTSSTSPCPTASAPAWS